MKLAGALAIVYVVWGSTYLAHRRRRPDAAAAPDALRALPDRGRAPLRLVAARRGELAAAARPARVARGGDRRRGAPRPRHGRRRLGRAARRRPGTTALLVASVPLFMALIDRAFFGIRLPLGAVAGIATGLVGVAILVGPSGARRPARRRGDPLARPSPGLPAPRTRASRRCRAAPFAGAAMQMLLRRRAARRARARDRRGRRVHPSAVSAASLGALLFLIVFGSLVAFTAYGWLLRNASTPLALDVRVREPRGRRVPRLGVRRRARRRPRDRRRPRRPRLGRDAVFAPRSARGARPPTPESHPPYIRSKDAQAQAVPHGPRLAELHRIVA